MICWAACLGGMAGGSAGSSGGGGWAISWADCLVAAPVALVQSPAAPGAASTDILGGMMGGGDSDGSRSGSGTQGRSRMTVALAICSADFLSSPAGKAVLAGTAAFAMKEVLGK